MASINALANSTFQNVPNTKDIRHKFPSTSFTPKMTKLYPRCYFPPHAKTPHVRADASASQNTSNQQIKIPDGSLDETSTVQVAAMDALRESTEALKAIAVQIEAEHHQEVGFQRSLAKVQGKLKGSPWDPIPGAPIPFSVFWKHAQAGNVKYMEYAEHGRLVAVMLPYKAEDLGLKIDSVKDSSEVVIWKRHPVIRMPADAQTEIWQQLRGQVEDIQFTQPLSPWNQTLPSLQLYAIWIVRLVVGLFLVRTLNRIILQRFKPRGLKEWPEYKKETLSQAINQGGYGLLGQSRARMITAEEKTGVTFDDFAGQEYVKNELKEVVSILKDDPKYQAMNVYCPKGVMLHGPPGTGKTLLARAIAGEAGLPFFSASGAEFVEMFAGIAAARVRDLFARAREFAPSIIFIDEIDAIGMARGGSDSGGGSVEREQGLIQILTEMDGFEKDDSRVLVIGATNRVDLLDSALLRKGRFDKILSVGRPTLEGRLAVLNVHARNKNFKSEEERNLLLKEVSLLTDDYSGAELMNVLNEASILAARHDKDIVEREELLEAIDRQEGRISTGEEDIREVTGTARLRLAYREASVAVLDCYYPQTKRPMKKTSLLHLEMEPNMEYHEPKNRVYSKKPNMIQDMVRACAPALIQDMVFGESNQMWSYGNAISEATQIAEYIILQTGQTAFGPIIYRTEKDLVSCMRPKLMALREEYVRYAVQKCESILVECQPAVEALTEIMLKKDEVYADEIWNVFNSSPRMPAPSVREIDEYYPLMDAGRWGIHGISLPGRVTFSPGNSGFATFGAPRPLKLKNMNPAEDIDKYLEILEEHASEKVELGRLRVLEGPKYGDVLLPLENVV